MNHFTTRKQFLVPSFELNIKEQEKLDKFLLILEKSEVTELIRIRETKYYLGGRPPYRECDMLATILYPHTIYSYTFSDTVLYREKVNSININELYYEEIKGVLENYFKDQEVVFHFTCGLSYLDSSQKIQELVDIDKKLVKQLSLIDS